MFSLKEKIEMTKWYYSGNSTREVSAMFGAIYPHRPIPHYSTISRMISKFERTGTLLNNCSCINSAQDVRNQDNENENNVLASVVENPTVSLRQVADNINVHYTTVRKILKKHNYKSYKFQCHQELLQQDMEKRAEFCFTLMEKINDDSEFLKNVCFTDECTFTIHNEPNRQNCRMWANENPRLNLMTRSQYPQKINVWAGILGHHIIGPFFLNGNLNGERFLQLLEADITPAIADVAAENQEIWFQMDGCPAHNCRDVKEFLSDRFNGRVIGRGYEISWPARSPDLSPNDFFLWGHLKSCVYSGKMFDNLDQLQNSIQNHCNRISPKQLANVRREFYNRLGHCLVNNGNLFEHLL